MPCLPHFHEQWQTWGEQRGKYPKCWAWGGSGGGAVPTLHLCARTLASLTEKSCFQFPLIPRGAGCVVGDATWLLQWLEETQCEFPLTIGGASSAAQQSEEPITPCGGAKLLTGSGLVPLQGKQRVPAALCGAFRRSLWWQWLCHHNYFRGGMQPTGDLSLCGCIPLTLHRGNHYAWMVSGQSAWYKDIYLLALKYCAYQIIRPTCWDIFPKELDNVTLKLFKSICILVHKLKT